MTSARPSLRDEFQPTYTDPSELPPSAATDGYFEDVDGEGDFEEGVYYDESDESDDPLYRPTVPSAAPNGGPTPGSSGGLGALSAAVPGGVALWGALAALGVGAWAYRKVVRHPPPRQGGAEEEAKADLKVAVDEVARSRRQQEGSGEDGDDGDIMEDGEPGEESDQLSIIEYQSIIEDLNGRRQTAEQEAIALRAQVRVLEAEFDQARSKVLEYYRAVKERTDAINLLQRMIFTMQHEDKKKNETIKSLKRQLEATRKACSERRSPSSASGGEVERQERWEGDAGAGSSPSQERTSPAPSTRDINSLGCQVPTKKCSADSEPRKEEREEEREEERGSGDETREAGATFDSRRHRKGGSRDSDNEEDGDSTADDEEDEEGDEGEGDDEDDGGSGSSDDDEEEDDDGSEGDDSGSDDEEEEEEEDSRRPPQHVAGTEAGTPLPSQLHLQGPPVHPGAPPTLPSQMRLQGPPPPVPPAAPPAPPVHMHPQVAHTPPTPLQAPLGYSAPSLPHVPAVPHVPHVPAVPHVPHVPAVPPAPLAGQPAMFGTAIGNNHVRPAATPAAPSSFSLL